MRESKGMCASYEPLSIPKLVFGFKLTTSLLAQNHLCTGPELFFGQKFVGKKGFILSLKSHLDILT